MYQTTLFRERARDHITRDIVSVSEMTTCGQLVARMRERSASSAIVQDARGLPVGIITEQDILRRVAFALDSDAPVTSVMTAPVHAIGEDDLIFKGLARMRRYGLRHMPVLSKSGDAVGVLQLHDILALASERVIEHVNALTRARSIEGMREVKEAQVGVARALLAEGEDPVNIQTLLCAINSDIYHQVVELSLEGMALDDWGTPPVPFEVIVMGSAGRAESFLSPDQDNGFVLADYPDDDHQRIDRWFIELASRMTAGLDAVGLPYCSGFVMASNPLWRKTESQWKRQIAYWVERRQPKTLLLCDIFFDFACVYGSGQMTGILREAVKGMVQHRGFLEALCLAEQSHDVGLSWLGQLQTESEHGPNYGKVNLKLTGTLPLVGATRLMALREGIAATGTLARLRALRQSDVISRNEYAELSEAFHVITRLLLTQQLQDTGAGLAPSKHVPPDSLTRRDHDRLKEAFRVIRVFKARVRSEFTGILVG